MSNSQEQAEMPLAIFPALASPRNSEEIHVAAGNGEITNTIDSDASGASEKSQPAGNANHSQDTEDTKTDVPEISLDALKYAQEFLDDSLFGRYLEVFRFDIGFGAGSFVVHSHTLSRRCPNFLGRIRARARPGSEPGVDCSVLSFCFVLKSTFQIFVGWLHNGQIMPLSAAHRTGPGEAYDETDLDRLVGDSRSRSLTDIEDIDLIRLYSFAKSEGIDELANEALTTLMSQNERYSRTTSKGAIQYIIKTYGDGAPLLNLFIEEAAARLSATNISSKMLAMPETYAVRVTAKVLEERAQTDRERASKNDLRRRVCDFHAHDGDEAKAACRKALTSRKPKGNFSADRHSLYDTTGIVAVGPGRLLFVVHKGLISRYSSYFQGAFSSGFAEAHSGVVDLNQESVDDFALFLNWVYTDLTNDPSDDDREALHNYKTKISERLPKEQAEPNEASTEAGAQDPDSSQDGLVKPLEAIRLDSQEDSSGQNAEADDSGDEDEGDDDPIEDETPPIETEDRRLAGCIQDMLVNLFIFADRRGIAKLRNDIMSRLAGQREAGWPWLSDDFERVAIAFSSLPSGSALRKFFVDEAAWSWDKDLRDVKDIEQLHPEFTAGLLRMFISSGRKLGGAYARNSHWRQDLCGHYHDHGTQVERENCKTALKVWQSQVSGKVEAQAVLLKYRVAL